MYQRFLHAFIWPIQRSSSEWTWTVNEKRNRDAKRHKTQPLKSPWQSAAAHGSVGLSMSTGRLRWQFLGKLMTVLTSWDLVWQMHGSLSKLHTVVMLYAIVSLKALFPRTGLYCSRSEQSLTLKLSALNRIPYICSTLLSADGILAAALSSWGVPIGIALNPLPPTSSCLYCPGE